MIIDYYSSLTALIAVGCRLPWGAVAGAGALQQELAEALQQSFCWGCNFAWMASQSGPELSWTGCWLAGVAALVKAVGREDAVALVEDDTPSEVEATTGSAFGPLAPERLRCWYSWNR